METEGINSFDFECGNEVYLNFEDTEYQLTSNFIGMHKEEYLIINIPDYLIKNKCIVEDNDYIGKNLDVSGVTNGVLIFFQTEIIKTMVHPVKIMILRYPKVIQNISFRKSKRLKCNIPFHKEKDGKIIPGVIQDINNEGCLCTIQTKDLKNIVFTEGEQVSLCCGSIKSKEKQIIHGKIVNIKPKDDGLKIGLTFTKFGDEIQKTIYKLIFE